MGKVGRGEGKKRKKKKEKGCKWKTQKLKNIIKMDDIDGNRTPVSSPKTGLRRGACNQAKQVRNIFCGQFNELFKTYLYWGFASCELAS